jgi:hypothetical protein
MRNIAGEVKSPVLQPCQPLGITRSMTAFINLCLVVTPHRLDPGDFGLIARNMQKLDPSILITIATPYDTADIVKAERWKHKSVTVAIGASGSFVPKRGPMLQSGTVTKLDQYSQMVAAGVATPRTGRFEFGKRYLPEEWSDFVILKPLPLTMTSKSGRTRLYRTNRLEHLSPHSLPEDHFLRDGPGLVQELVDTGVYPSKFRVLSLLGDPLYCSVTRSMAPRVSLDASDEDIEASIIDAKNPLSKAADVDNKRGLLVKDHDVLAFARKVHGAFPRKPVLGIDILKRESDGKLFALEINAGGNVWHLSSPKEEHRIRLGGKEAMVAQLGAWDVAARALIRVAKQHAA